MTQETIYDDTIPTDPTGGTSAGSAAQSARGNLETLWLAGVGAMAVACDVAGERFERYVRRGEKVRENLQDRAEDLRREGTGRSNRLRGSFQRTMDVFLDGLHVPNKTDVDTINIKLNLLTRKLDDLQMQSMATRSRRTPPAPPPEPPTEAGADAPAAAEPGELYPPS